MAENGRHQIDSIVDPSGLSGCLEAVDAGILQFVAIRTRLMNEMQDAFTGLRSSAQLFREIFFGVDLPIDSPKILLDRAGGALRLIRVSYKETGLKVFALADVIDAIPHFEKVFPIKSFEKLAAQLEKIREDDTDAGATWFVEKISNKHLRAALEQEARTLASGDARIFPQRQGRATVAVCGCCGATQSPASMISAAFADLSCSTGATRWSGRPAPTTHFQEPTKGEPARAMRRAHGAS